MLVSPESGKVYEATGGNAQDGAAEFTLIFEPPVTGIELFADMAMMGWAITAKRNGKVYMIEGGLRVPGPRLKYWARNLRIVENAILKAEANEVVMSRG